MPVNSPGAPIDSASGRVLTINGGSSSIKFALFEAGEPPRRVLGGSLTFAGGGLRVTRSGQPAERHPLAAGEPTEAVDALLDWLQADGALQGVTAVAHRVVHGGPDYDAPQLVTPELIADLVKATPFAPNHLPLELRLIDGVTRRLPGVPQVVCLDTGFHRELPPESASYSLPPRYRDAGVKRYGFHGLSFAYLLEELGRQAGAGVAGGKVILAHLGSGSSLAAVRGGRGVDTTMGLTPAGGVVMATRTGDLDPGVLLHILRAEGLSADQLDRLVNREGGLLGVSGTSSDMLELLSRRDTDPRAALAISLFVHSVRKAIGAMAATLGGVETLVFAGGIGENAPVIRAEILDGLGFLGVRLDAARNGANAAVISAEGAACAVRVIPTDEELAMARIVARKQYETGRHLGPTPPLARRAAPASVAPASDESLRKVDAYWRAANYLSVGQIYLLDNPLLREPLASEHVKPRLLGHWGTTPGLNFLYAHLNRVIVEYDLNVLYVAGPGHGGPALVANVYLEGTYTEVYPHVTQDEAGLRRLFKQFSFPGGIPSHVAPETPGSIHEGGELGYSLSHAYGAAFDNPDLIVACVVGDGEAETGPLATAWHSNKFLDPAGDGAVLPILHLNGYKIANPAVLARVPHDELEALFRGYGYAPHFVEGHEPAAMHRAMAAALDACVAEIRRIQADARTRGVTERPRWPMVVLRSPKGWTCPRVIEGKLCEGSWRSHQVPMADVRGNPGRVRVLEGWLKSYRPEELFDGAGRLVPELAELAPKGERRMGANPHANGGRLLRPLDLPDFRDFAVAVPAPGATVAEATRVMGTYLKEVTRRSLADRNFRLFSPDEFNSNRWNDVLDVTDRRWLAERLPGDEHLAPDGRVMEVLSEHQCEGWLEGYLLTGRHGFFSCYEAFIHIIDSMFNQHAKWLKVCGQIPWRAPIASLNYLLSSHVWRQDHNGFSHQDPGFLDHVVNKKAGVVRVYLPPDANTLLSVTDHCLRSRDYVNVVVAGKQPAPQWLDMAAAERHCAAGAGVWGWAGTAGAGEPDVVLACCGDVPTLETLAAAELLREHLPDLKVRVVNVVDLMCLQPASEHPHGLSDVAFDTLFTRDRQVIFAFHGYPALIHRLTYRRANHRNLHVRGYKEEGTTTTPFDMVVMNDMDRFHLVKDVIDRVPGLAARAAGVRGLMVERRAEHKRYIAEYGIDMPEIDGWRWGARPAAATAGDTAADNV